MNTDIRIKELESAVNQLWRVQGKYSVKVIVDESGKMVFSVYENQTKELLMDLVVPYGGEIMSIAKALEQELRNTYVVDFTNRMKPRTVNTTSNVLGFKQYIREAKFYCEWIDIFGMIEEEIVQQSS